MWWLEEGHIHVAVIVAFPPTALAPGGSEHHQTSPLVLDNSRDLASPIGYQRCLV